MFLMEARLLAVAACKRMSLDAVADVYFVSVAAQALRCCWAWTKLRLTLDSLKYRLVAYVDVVAVAADAADVAPQGAAVQYVAAASRVVAFALPVS